MVLYELASNLVELQNFIPPVYLTNCVSHDNKANLEDFTAWKLQAIVQKYACILQ